MKGQMDEKAKCVRGRERVKEQSKIHPKGLRVFFRFRLCLQMKKHVPVYVDEMALGIKVMSR